MEERAACWSVGCQLGLCVKYLHLAKYTYDRPQSRNIGTGKKYVLIKQLILQGCNYSLSGAFYSGCLNSGCVFPVAFILDTEFRR